MKSSYQEAVQGFEGPTLIHRWGSRSTAINSTLSLSKERVGDGADDHSLASL